MATLYQLNHQFSSVAQSSPTLCDPMYCSTPGPLPVHHQLLQFIQTHVKLESAMPSNHLILCRPLLLLPSIGPSIRVFSNGTCLKCVIMARAVMTQSGGAWPGWVWVFQAGSSPAAELWALKAAKVTVYTCRFVGSSCRWSSFFRCAQVNLLAFSH